MAKNNTVMTVAIILAAAFFLSGGLTGNAARRDFSFTTPVTSETHRPAGAIGCQGDGRLFGEILPGGDAAIVDSCGKVLEYCSDYAGSGVQSTQPFRTVRLSYWESILTCANNDLRTGTQEPTLVGTRPVYRPN